jgi:hypothetical protein
MNGNAFRLTDYLSISISFDDGPIETTRLFSSTVAERQAGPKPIRRPVRREKKGKGDRLLFLNFR